MVQRRLRILRQSNAPPQARPRRAREPGSGMAAARRNPRFALSTVGSYPVDVVGSNRLQLQAEQGGLHLVLVDADNISFVIFGAETAPTTLRPNGTSSVIADDFSWGLDAGSAVSAPEPSPIVLGLVALAAGMLARRRRSNTGWL